MTVPALPPSPEAPPVRVVCAVLFADRRLLACQRPPGKALAGCWEFPGGKVEEGETDEAALARELAEELGLTVTIGDRLPAVRHRYPRVTVDLIPFVCHLAPDHPPPEQREHAALRWLGRDELGDVAWAEADWPLIDHLRAAWPPDQA